MERVRSGFHRPNARARWVLPVLVRLSCAIGLWCLGCSKPGGSAADDETGGSDGSCVVGSQGCPCTGGGGCDEGLECQAGTCVAPTCPTGAAGCPCTSGGACDPGLECMDGFCLNPQCPIGEAGCPCTEGGACDPGLMCEDGTCFGGGTSTGDSGAETVGPDVPPPAIPSVMLVIDKSGSTVSNTWDHDGNAMTNPVRRWSSMHAAIAHITAMHEADVDFGASLFPAMTATQDYSSAACPVQANVEVPVAPMNAQGVLDGLPGANATQLHGGTPAERGINAAWSHLATFDDPRALVVITDGPANCSQDAMTPIELFEVYDNNVEAIVADALAQDGIRTYVVGVEIEDEVTPVVNDGAPDGINPFEKWTDVAVAGGTQQIYNAFDEDELKIALEVVLNEILG